MTGLPRRYHLLLPQAQAVGDHGDELRIRRLALDVRDRVAEKLLQRLNIAAVPCDLDRVPDFRDFRPKFRDALSRFCEGSQPLDSLACS